MIDAIFFNRKEVKLNVRITGKNRSKEALLTFNADCIKIAQVCG